MKTLVTVIALAALVHQGACQRATEDPCKRRSGHSEHEEYCDKYYECVGENQVVVRDCPNGLVYAGRDGLVDVCHYEYDYPCKEGLRRNPAVSTEHCDWLYGIFGHETSCTRYWTCWNGTASEQFCVAGLLYSEETHSCDWPDQVADCQKHPLCVEDANANVPLGDSCNRYWSCQGGYPRLMQCPASLVFDKDSRRCVHPPTKDCDVPPTLAPEEEEGPLAPEKPNRQQSSGNPFRGRRPQRPVVAVPQQLDAEPEYVDEQFDQQPQFQEEQFAPRPQQQPQPQQQPARAAVRQQQRPGNFRRPSNNAGGPRPGPLRGPQIPQGAIPIN